MHAEACSERSAAQVGFEHARIAQQVFAAVSQHDLAGFQYVAVLRDLQRLTHILLDQENRQTLGIDGAQDAEAIAAEES